MLNQLQDRARPLRKRIVLPEGEDVRTVHAALMLHDRGLARPVLLGREDAVRDVASGEGLAIPGGLPVIDPARSEKAGDYARELFNLRKDRGMTFEAARERVHDPLYFGALMVRRGEADGSVAGAANATADVLRAAIQVVGVASGSALVSSFFLMILPDGRAVTFADCGVVPDPDPAQLASIGLDAARSHRLLTGEEPRVAFLSFSTHGSASHPRVDKVREATQRARDARPDLKIDGELQFDAAFDAGVGERKAPGSPVAGHANVFVFPDLDSGNLGYKIAQRVGGAEALGPVLQGLARPCNDLSRGATAEDVANVAVITAILAAEPA
jgi:phosphate acetyltransferase